ncbi:MAG: hypothetical protein IKK46_02585 [Clostridia bacterium]|nr:hypothetical protein [Clostridia bacterium]
MTGEKTPRTVIKPERKIKVFISSICGDKAKYDRVRAELKEAIESTNLAEVYLFEDRGASTLTAGSHYTWALEDSDVCIFLIDNADGVTPGVQVEIDTVKKHRIKALYYFCDETSKEKTAVEQNLMGAQFAKSKTVNKFDELSYDGAQALVNDIVDIYHYYCTNKISERYVDGKFEYQGIDIVGSEETYLPTMPKTILKNIDKCKGYLLEYVIGETYHTFTEQIENTSEIDEWGHQFLSVLLKGTSIKQFNTGMFLDCLAKSQAKGHFEIIKIRWQAIQSYFLGDIEKCIEYLESALKLAKETNCSPWIIKDILVDLRNQSLTLGIIKNSFWESEAQKELTESSEELYYPVLDRINESLNERYIEGFYKEKTTSPYTVSMGNNLEVYGDLIASLYIVSIYNGSLTHILLLHEKIKNFLFYLSNKYSDWSFKFGMLKIAVYEGKEKEVKALLDSYPEILNNMSEKDAEEVMEYCNNHPIKYKRLISQLIGFGVVGYYLADKKYNELESELVSEIKVWIQEENATIYLGQSIFYCLSNVLHRMSQDVVSEICCMFMDNHYSRWYTDIFKLLQKVDLNKMSESFAKNLIEHILIVLKDENELEQIKYSPVFLCGFRKQNRNLTEELDKAILEYLPSYYNGDYKLETTENEQIDLPIFVQQYVENVREKNKNQGKNGTYFSRGVRDIAVIRSILIAKEVQCLPDILDSVISVTCDTLLNSKENLLIKLDAISLLITIVLNFDEDYKRNIELFEKIFQEGKNIEADISFPMLSNVNKISLKIGLQLLYTAMGKDTYVKLLELFPYIQNDTPTTISVVGMIIKYLENNDMVKFPENIEIVLLQNVLQWLNSDHLDIRWNATRILIKLLRNPNNRNIINNKLINLVDNESVYIKNLILQNMNSSEGIMERTREYIISKCENDANYVVRLVCSEIKGKT